MKTYALPFLFMAERHLSSPGTELVEIEEVFTPVRDGYSSLELRRDLVDWGRS